MAGAVYASSSDNVPSVVAENGDTHDTYAKKDGKGSIGLTYSLAICGMLLLAYVNGKTREYETTKAVDVTDPAHFGIKFSILANDVPQIYPRSIFTSVQFLSP